LGHQPGRIYAAGGVGIICIGGYGVVAVAKIPVIRLYDACTDGGLVGKIKQVIVYALPAIIDGKHYLRQGENRNQYG
jgi:hypothetical protein